MGQDPGEIRQDIEETREELGETVAALAEKTDVKAQAKGKVADTKAKVTGKVAGAKDSVKSATPDGAGQGAQQAVTAAKQNPIPTAAVGAFAGGVVVGWLLGRRS